LIRGAQEGKDMNQKKNCDFCRAADSFKGECRLGYTFKVVRKWASGIVVDSWIPTEPCPKPTTIKDMEANFEKYKKILSSWSLRNCKMERG